MTTHRQTAQQRAAQFDKPILAVQMIQRELGAGIERVEFVTTGDRGATYFPVLHEWPRDVQQSLRATARRWCADNGINGVLATACMVDHSQEPPVLTLALLFERTSGADAPDVAPPAAASEKVSPPLSPPVSDHCRIAGCGE